MKLSHRRLGILILITIVSTAGCGYINGIRAKSQLNEAVSAYKDKKYDEAEKYARRAMELDPTNENAPLILAVTLQTEYRRGDTTDPNKAKAEEAINLYKKVEEKDPNNDQAFTAVTVLLGFLDKTDEQQEWVLKRANNEAVTKERRSDALSFLANNDWNCSLAITDSKDSKKLVQNGDKVTVQYSKPTDSKQVDQAVKCATSGLEKVEKAISLNPDSDTAWALKSNLLREEAKIAKWDKNDSKATDYEKQATEAAQQSTQLKAKKQPTPTPPPST